MSSNFTFMLSNMIQKEPGPIVGPIAGFIGWILNFLFDIAYSITYKHSLGVSIILLTIIVRCLMLPIMFKQQKSMISMQKLQPDIEKINKKYGDSKDPEIQQKKGAEIQNLYSKNKVNPLSGCLPIFITFPIFIALNYVMNQSYLFVTKLDEIYRSIATTVIDDIPNYVSVIKPIAYEMLPNKMSIDISLVDDMMKVLNKFSTENFAAVLASAPAGVQAALTDIITHKQDIEYFFGISLIDRAGLSFPGILIPILAAVTTYFSSWISMRYSRSSDPNMKQQQRIMLIVMPIMMGFMTISMPSGVGLYWIVSSMFQLVQQPLINKYYKFEPNKAKEA